MALLAALAQFSLDLIARLGYVGLFLLMVSESMVLPTPSEAVLPFAGYLSWRGDFTLWLAWVVATLGTLAGSLLSYALGAYGVRPLLERWGKYVLVTPAHLDAAHAFFERRSAGVGIFLSRFVPVVRHLISIPAGSARMPLLSFSVATVLGGGAWNFVLLYFGYALGKNWEQVTALVDEWKWVILGAAVVAAFAALVVWRMRQKRVRDDVGGGRSPRPPP